MSSYWEKFSVFVNEKTLRERAIIMLVMVVLVYGLCDLLFMGALLDFSSRQSSQLASLQQSNSDAQREIENLMALLSGSREATRRERQQLSDKLTKIDAELSSAASGFVPATLMPKVLEEMLIATRQLTLIKLENIPVEMVAGNSDPDVAGDEDSTQLYRHGVEMQLQGGYLATLEYLKQLEQLQWRFQWQALQFEVDEYPTGMVTLEVYTYSTEKDWLGV